MIIVNTVTGSWIANPVISAMKNIYIMENHIPSGLKKKKIIIVYIYCGMFGYRKFI